MSPRPITKSPHGGHDLVNGTETNYTTTLLSAGDAIKVYTNVTSTGTTGPGHGSGIVQIATGALSSTGTAFPTYYKHS